MLLLQVILIATFQLSETNFVNINMSLMLLLQVMMVTMFKLTDKLIDSQDIFYVILASDDGCHIQVDRYNW